MWQQFYVIHTGSTETEGKKQPSETILDINENVRAHGKLF